MDPIKKLTEFDAKKKAFSLFGEFKAFAFKGNVVDMAVGVIIGAAFGKIITSLVDNIIMPALSYVTGGGEHSYEKWTLGNIKIGLFLGDLLSFLLIAFILFLVIVKFLGWLLHAKTQAAVSPPPMTKDQELLSEIRDILRHPAPPGA